MKKMTVEQIEKKKNYIREQLEYKTGIYATLFIRTYNFILNCCHNNNQNWCFGKDVNDRVVAKYAYAATEYGNADHMGSSIINNIKQELSAMGYISFRLVDGAWRIYIKSDLDFLDCSLEYWITETNKNLNKEISDKKKLKDIYNHLCKHGINIYAFNRRCWKCGNITTIYTYYIDIQIKHELGSAYSMSNPNIVSGDAFDNFFKTNPKPNCFSEIGIGTITKIELILAKKIKTITKKYTQTMDKTYYMNICQHCQVAQGINFTVFHPTELESLSDNEIAQMKKFTISVAECDLKEEDLVEFM